MTTIFSLAVVLAQLQAPSAPAAVRGFPRDMVAVEARSEDLLRAVPNADTLRHQLETLAAVPHEAGTERSRHVAELILARFKAFGLDAHIEQFEALMPRPVSRTLELVGPDHYTAVLKEPAVAGDPTSGQPDQLPTFNAYAADGDVTGDLVYVNYGTPEDYRVLDSLGVSVRGKIVLARYGRSWRGIKVKVAAEHGALGCIIYSDPRDDGYWVQDVWPTGPMRPWGGVQRGSVMEMELYPGDPESPGWASVPGDHHRLTQAEARTLEPIPALPISYEDALPLLRDLTGPVAPAAWRGALPVTYHVGPGASRVHLAVKFDWAVRPLYDVIATVPGATEPNQWVVYGNHHDAWVNGAEDPLSGQVSLDETARAFGALLKSGWRPARTIVFAAWDGEEWGLLGSTEWAERHAAELEGKAVVYFNSDSNDKGWLGVGGSPSLETFFQEVARDVTDPETGKSVLAAALAHERQERGRRADTTFTLGALGSGSDYSAFVDHLGIASSNSSYGGGTPSGIYHSIYDDPAFYEKFLDPKFDYEVTESRTMATAIARMADAPVLPFAFGPAARHFRAWADEIDSTARADTALRGLDLSGLQGAIGRLDSAAARYDAALAGLAGLTARDVARRRAALTRVNILLAHAEHALADSAGLPGRPWYRNLAYAPGFYTGYGVKTFPGVREAVERGRLAEARTEAARAAAAVGRFAGVADSAAAALAAALR